MLRIAPIVEGHGEVAAAPILLRRLGEWLANEYVEIIRPHREKRNRLVANKDDCLHRAIQLASNRLNALAAPDDKSLVLVLFDADDDLPCVLGPDIQTGLIQRFPHIDVCCVIANRDYESWFVSSAESLDKYLILPPQKQLPPEDARENQGKGWLKANFRGVRYSETVDQPKLTNALDLNLCRQRSPSFDKLCRELEKRLLP